MTMTYGIQRVLEPKNVLPTSAWKLQGFHKKNTP